MGLAADPPDLPVAITPLPEHDRRWMREASRQNHERAIRAAACRETTVTQRFLLDNMVYDRLVEPSDRWHHVVGLCLAGHLGLLMTDIQHEEITANPDVEIVVKVLSLPAINVPASGVVLGVSRINMARFGDPDLLARLRSPGDDAVPPWPEPPDVPAGNESRTQRLRKRHTGDALLAATALDERAVLVTGERRRLRNFAAREGIPVWDTERFLAHVDALSL